MLRFLPCPPSTPFLPQKRASSSTATLSIRGTQHPSGFGVELVDSRLSDFECLFDGFRPQGDGGCCARGGCSGKYARQSETDAIPASSVGSLSCSIKRRMKKL